MKPASKQLDLLLRDISQVISIEEFHHKIAQGRPLLVKFGADPTAPDLHLGHSIVLHKLRQFQDLGHKAVLIIGDYTALIGDPTGQNKTRPMLSEREIEKNAKTYVDQASKILDPASEKLEIRHNSEWFATMSFADVIRLASKMTVARMLERDTFEKRYKGGDPIHLHEFLYPLMQGYDSVVIQADVELGGTDQTFNNLIGRELQKDADQEPQVVMILPILTGLDGTEKMSKSKGNDIALTDPPQEIFGKTMSISDNLMWQWYTLLQPLLFETSKIDVASLKSNHPMEAKKILAQALVTQFYGKDAAQKAREDFEQKFSKRDTTKADLPEFHINPSQSWNILELVMATGAVTSRNEARRLIQQGGIVLDGSKLKDPYTSISLKRGMVLKIGKKHFFRLVT